MASSRNRSKRLLNNISRFVEAWNVARRVINGCNILAPTLWLTALGWMIYDIGFNPIQSNDPLVNRWLLVLLRMLVVFMGLRWLAELSEDRKFRSRLVSLGAWLIVFGLYAHLLPAKIVTTQYDTNKYLLIKSFLYAVIFLMTLTEASLVLRFVYRRSANPAFLFVASFALLVVLGALLLMLPNATWHGLGGMNALFTATSAVCVTGLSSVDTATVFTPFGHTILLVLIQIGGLGIMTFTGLISYALAGSISFSNELVFRNMLSSNRLGNVMRFVYRIVLVTLLSEAIGAACIYFSLDNALFARKLDKLFFAVFHAVSAFCNAGFSTLPDGLHNIGFRFNYSLQWWIACLVILGGLGFPIVFNIYSFVKMKWGNLYWRLTRKGRRHYVPRLINVNSRLALATTCILLVVGLLAYLTFERNNTLQEHPTILGKLVTSFFGSVTPRTAGFHTVDMATLNLSTIVIFLLLMWVGASPGSTGGGIKTTTLAVAILNMTSIIRGKDRSEVFRSEISTRSIHRAFALMILSLLVIGVTVFLLSVQDSDKGLVRLAFEAFSAFSTVGLSLGITGQLSDLSKLVLVVTMFIGRVGALTMVMAFVKQSPQLFYRYPQEDITF